MELIREGGGLTISAMPEEGWDRFAAGDDCGTFCHLAAWQGIFEDVLGHETSFRCALDSEGAIRGLLPLVRIRSRLFGHYLVSMPFLNYGGAIGSPEAQHELNRWATAEAQRLRVDLLELRNRHAAPADSTLRTTQRKLTVLLPLPHTAAELWERGFGSKLRSQIRRAQKEGLEIRFGPGEIEPFYDVFARTMRDLGTPVLPRALFEAIGARLRSHAQFAVVYLGDQPVAAGAGFHFGDEFEMTWAGSLREHSRAAPNMLLYWGCMEEAIRQGRRGFNFGRCSEGSGTHRFKRQWGGADVPLPWLQCGAETSTPNPGSGKYATALAVWRRLPVAVTNRVGPPIARLIP